MFLLGWMCRILVLAPLPVLHHKSTKYQEQQSQNSLCEAGEGHSWEASLKRGLCVRAQSDSLWSHGLWPSRLLRPWNFSGKNTGMCCHFLLQGIFRSQASNLCLLLCRWILYHWATREVQDKAMTRCKHWRISFSNSLKANVVEAGILKENNGC